MSRVIIKNVPKVFTEKEIVDNFRKIDEITDCKVIRSENGESRRFAFVGFKGKDTATFVSNKFNNTYLGASKIMVSIAKTKTEQDQQRSRSRDNHRVGHKETKQSTKAQKLKQKQFENYKKVVSESVKQSWNDVVVPEYNVVEETNQSVKKKKSEENVTIKKKSKEKMQEQSKPSSKQPRQQHQTYEQKIPIVKAPIISQKNKKYVTKPLEVDSKRLYITNLPYELKQEDLKSTFARFGNISNIKLPKDQTGKTKGFAFITYQKQEQALRVFSQLDNKVVFGRIIHIKPSLEDIGSIIKAGKQMDYEQRIRQQYGDKLQQKTSFKKRKKREMREKLNDMTSWNTLFLNPNTILERIARKLKITKAEILLSESLAPKIALAETEVIQETKEWMAQVGINIEFLGLDRELCERSRRILFIKNLNFKTQESDLRELMQFYGIVNKLILSPNRAIAIVQYQTQEFAANAMQKLQNYKYKNNFLYLEYAPLGMLDETAIQNKITELQKEIEQQEELSKVVYVKNLNFITTENSLREVFEKIGLVRSVKIIKTKDGKSMGYGFAEFEKGQVTVEAIKKLQNTLLDGHRILLSLSRKKVGKYEDLKELKEKIKAESVKGNNKLLVKNLAFQATKAEVQQLFSEFGSIRKIRLPKKIDGQHRGFAFVEYDSLQQAALAKQALSSTHLYGRKLVIEYEKGSTQI